MNVSIKSERDDVSYKVPKEQVAACVAVAGRPLEDVALFLGATARHHAGPERPSDVLADSDPFLPVSGSDGVKLVRKGAIRWLSIAAELELGGSLEAALQRAGHEAVPVQIAFDDGTILRGSIVTEQPEGQQRVLDFLNAAPRFFPVREENTVHWVNRERIVEAAQI